MKKKRVYLFDSKGNFFMDFINQTEAAKFLNCAITTV